MKPIFPMLETKEAITDYLEKKDDEVRRLKHVRQLAQELFLNINVRLWEMGASNEED